MKTSKKAFALSITALILLSVLSAPLLGFQFKTTIGTSMNPTISQGDIAVIYTNFKDLEKGDIICFEYQMEDQEYLFLHRIVEINDHIRTKGDNMPEPDSYLVNRSDVIGKAVLVIPKAGRLFQMIHNVYGFVLLIIVPAALLIGIEIREMRKSKKS